MSDYRINWTQPLPPLGNKIERHVPTEQDRKALEFCKFEQKRHEVDLADVRWEPAAPPAEMVWHIVNLDRLAPSIYQADFGMFDMDAVVIHMEVEDRP